MQGEHGDYGDPGAPGKPGLDVRFLFYFQTNMTLRFEIIYFQGDLYFEELCELLSVNL